MTSPAEGDGDREDLLCPSAACEPGALLLGVVGGDGRVGYIRPALEIDEGFIARARAGRAPEKRFRFAQPCERSACHYWSEGRCGVADAAAESDQGGDEGPLPACAIRPRCRWFAQSGPGACRTCPLVITDVTSSG
jgi:hypothetical protein